MLVWHSDSNLIIFKTRVQLFSKKWLTKNRRFFGTKQCWESTLVWIFEHRRGVWITFDVIPRALWLKAEKMSSMIGLADRSGNTCVLNRHLTPYAGVGGLWNHQHIQFFLHGLSGRGVDLENSVGCYNGGKESNRRTCRFDFSSPGGSFCRTALLRCPKCELGARRSQLSQCSFIASLAISILPVNTFTFISK